MRSKLIIICLIMSTQLVSTGCISIFKKSHSNTDPDDADIPHSTAIVLKSGLMLKVVVFVAGAEEISETRRISQKGFISLPLVGRFMVHGLTIDKLTQSLEAHYAKDFFVNPTVDISFVTDTTDAGMSPWGFVTVLGRVKTPGHVSLPATQDMTLSLAIQRAGGFASSAKQTAIRITRQLKDGQKETIKVDLNRVGSKGKGEEDIALKPGDIIYIPEKIF